MPIKGTTKFTGGLGAIIVSERKTNRKWVAKQSGKLRVIKRKNAVSFVVSKQ